MKNAYNNSTFKVAFSASIAALSTVLMMLTGLIPVGTYALPCFAGIFISAVVIEFGFKWAAGVYVVVSILSFFLSGDKEAVIYFIMIFGYYPMLKGLIEGKIRLKAVQYILKLAVFNAAAITAFFIATLLLAIPAQEYTIAGFYVPWAFLIAGNIFFIIYDFAITSVITYYIRVLRKKLFKKK